MASGGWQVADCGWWAVRCKTLMAGVGCRRQTYCQTFSFSFSSAPRHRCLKRRCYHRAAAAAAAAASRAGSRCRNSRLRRPHHGAVCRGCHRPVVGAGAVAGGLACCRQPLRWDSHGHLGSERVIGGVGGVGSVGGVGGVGVGVSVGGHGGVGGASMLGVSQR